MNKSCKRQHLADLWGAKSLLVFLFISINACSVWSQFVSAVVQVYPNGSDAMGNGTGLSFFDFNKDGWDDITICDAGFPIKMYVNNQNNTFTLTATLANTWSAKHPVWVDFDNDNDYDLFITYKQHSCKLFRNDGSFAALVDITASLDLPSSTGNSYGCAWGDYDKDSYLDVYICNFHLTGTEETNWLLHNNGDGTFTNVTDLFNVGLDQVTSFQPSWVDIDNNGWQDLYVVNDHNYTNAMFMNDGVGLANMAADLGLDAELLSMSNSVADYDQDGDFDFYIANGSDGNYLMRNDSLQFTNVAEESNAAVYSSCWNTLWMDVDNDGYEDLHVCVNYTMEDNRMLINDTQGMFTTTYLPLTSANNRSYSAAKGDFDNDGRIDFFNYSQEPPMLTLFHNQYTTENNWVKYDLEGTISNRDGIGTKVEVHCDEEVYSHYTFCGNNYLSQDSQHRLIGIAEHVILDSLILTWPSGWVDKHYSLSANASYAFTEGETYTSPPQELIDVALCVGEAVLLDAGEWAGYSWYDGSAGQTTEVTTGGTYEVTVMNEFGFSKSILFLVEEVQALELEIDVMHPLCHNGNDGQIAITTTNGEIANIVWNGTAGEAMLSDLGDGDYVYQVYDMQGCMVQDTVELVAPDALVIEYSAPAACFGAATTASAQVFGGIGPYVLNWNGADPQNLIGGEYLLTVTDANQCEATELIQIYTLAPISVTCTAPLACYSATVSASYLITGGAGNYVLNWNGANPDSLHAGDYLLNVVDENNCTATENFSVYEATELVLTPEITNAYEGANGMVVMNVAGGYEPYTYLWSGGGDTNVLMEAAQGSYICHVTDAMTCSKSTEVQVIDLGVDVLSPDVMVYPNPFETDLQLSIGGSLAVTICDSQGRVMFKEIMAGHRVCIDTSHWSIGFYVMLCDNKAAYLIKR